MGKGTDFTEEEKETLSERTKRVVKDTGERAKTLGSNVMEGVKTNRVTRAVVDNPIPAVLLGIGIGWLVVKGFTRSNGRYETAEEFGPYEPSEEFETQETVQSPMETAGQTFENVKSTAGETLNRAREKVSQAREKAGEMMGQAKEKASQFRSEASVRAQSLKERYQDTLENKPLVLLGAAFVIGLLLGLSVPETRSEHELMGPAKDRLIRRAKEMAREKIEKVEHVAMEVRRSAAEKAKEEGLLS